MIADRLVVDVDAPVESVEKQIGAQLVGIARQRLVSMHLGEPGLARQQHRIQAEIGTDIEERLQPVLADQGTAPRDLGHLVGSTDDQLLVDPVAVVEQPASLQSLVDREPGAQPIQPLENAPMQFTHVFTTPSACQ